VTDLVKQLPLARNSSSSVSQAHKSTPSATRGVA